MSSIFSECTIPRPFKRRRSGLPAAYPATGRTLSALTNVEIQRILDREETPGGILADFFAASPLRESGLEIDRPQDGPRELSTIDLAELGNEPRRFP